MIRADFCARCRREADDTRPQWRAIGDDLVCPHCLSPLEADTAPRAPVSPISRYVKVLKRDLDTGPVQRRRIVSEVEGHLRDIAAEETSAHDLSQWQSERLAIARVGDIDAIVGGYELGRPPGRRRHRLRIIWMAGLVVAACTAIVLVHDHERAHATATPPCVLGLPRAPNAAAPHVIALPASGSTAAGVSLHFTLPAKALCVSMRIYKDPAAGWIALKNRHNPNLGTHAFTWMGETRDGEHITRSRYYWQVVVTWPSGAITRSDVAPIDVT